MPKRQQILIFLCTGALAAAVAVYAPRALPGLTEIQGLLAGLAVLFIGVDKVASGEITVGHLLAFTAVILVLTAVLLGPPTPGATEVPHRLSRVHDECRALYDTLYAHRITA